MKKIFILISLVLNITLFADESQLYKTSYNCTNLNPITTEYKICTDSKLAKLDVKLNAIYKGFYTVSKPLIKSQNRWIEQRNNCNTIACIKESYTSRITSLQESRTNQKTYPKEVLDAIHDSLSMEEKEFDYYPEVSESMAIEYFNAFFNFKMQFKKPLLENVKYENKELQHYLGECKAFRLDKVAEPYGKGDDFNFNEHPDPMDFAIWNVAEKNQKYILLLRSEHHYYPKMDKKGITKTIFLLSSSKCKKIINDYYTYKIKGVDVPYPKVCETITKKECELSKQQGVFLQRSLYIGPSSIKNRMLVTYNGSDYILKISRFGSGYFSLEKILDTKNRFNFTPIFYINYKKGI